MKAIALFDVDGTLTKPRNKVTDDVLAFLQQLHQHVHIGLVGGSDLKKIKEQMGEDLLHLPYIDYVFSENGVVAFKGNSCIHTTDLSSFLGEDTLQRFINFALRYIATLTIPVKRGTFIEYRNGMLNISPIGRNCSQDERDQFEAYDRDHQIRASMIKALQDEFRDVDLQYSIGGQISFDVMPRGWDKTFCLRFLDQYETVYFWGDKTEPGQNDHEIYTSKEVCGYRVVSYQDTMNQCRALFDLSSSDVQEHAYFLSSPAFPADLAHFIIP